MKPLSAHRTLQLATNAVPILKHLKYTDKTMTLKQFGQALGITSQAWKPEHEEQIATVLTVVQTTFARLNEDGIEYHRISHGKDGHWYRRQWVTEQF
jgi:hypothetical protein